MKPKKPFWEVKSLDQMTTAEWEALCDRCALCCLHKYEDQETHEIIYTGVACRMLNAETCLCKAYPSRLDRVDDCIKIKPRNFSKMHLLPLSCAYRRLSEGKQLEWWHHLLSGSRETVHDAGVSVRGKSLPEENVHPDDIPKFILFKID